MAEEPEQAEQDLVTLASFLVDWPPGRTARIGVQPDRAGNFSFDWPKRIMLFCGRACGGHRYFEPAQFEGAVGVQAATRLTLYGVTRRLFTRRYVCRNCGGGTKDFALVAGVLEPTDNPVAVFTKVGEIPAFGGPLPERLRDLAGEAVEYLEKGLEAESQGLGIGAFAYYRRFVDHQKDALLDKIIEVARLENADEAIITGLQAVKREHRFSAAMRNMAPAVPPSLLIRGQNPLSLLHGALSTNLHGQDDTECLRLASDVRTTLSALAERVAQALADDDKLKEAVTRLAAARRPRPAAEN